MQTVRIRRGATLWFPPRKLELAFTHAGWPFICFEITDGWVRARMFRTTIKLASSRRVEVNPDLRLDPDTRRVLGPRTRFFSVETARRVFRTTTKVALRFIIKSLHLTRPRALVAFSRPDEADPSVNRTRERGEVNILAFDASGAHQANPREGERWSWHWPVKPTTLQQILLEVEDDDRFREIVGALRQAGFRLTDRNPSPSLRISAPEPLL
jgi:hypothetical protein